MKERTIKTAIDFIKSSTVVTSDTYSSLTPLILKILNDKLEKQDIYDLLDSVACLTDEAKEAVEEPPLVTKEVESVSDDNETKDITSIESVTSVCNAGLVDKLEPIALSAGINILFGLNASGKSSAYKCICNALGHHSKTILSNVNEKETKSSCSIKVKCGDEEPKDLTWESGNVNKKHNIKIFDTDVSLSLVKDDQENKFSLSHLKSEYFAELMTLYDVLEAKLKGRKKMIAVPLEAIRGNLEVRASSIYGDLTEKKLEKEYVEACNMSIEESDTLEGLLKKRAEFDKINFNDKIALLQTTREQLSVPLKALVRKVPAESVKNSEDVLPSINLGDKEEHCLELIFGISWFDEIRKEINGCNELKNIVEKDNKTALIDSIPSDWTTRNTWKKFIEKSIEFVNDLSNDERKVYTEEKCPYCYNTLEAGGKELIKSYLALQSEAKNRLKVSEKNIKDYIERLDVVYTLLVDMKRTQSNLDKNIQQATGFTSEILEIDKTIVIFNKVINALKQGENINVSQEQLETSKQLIVSFLGTYNKLTRKKDEYKAMSENKEKECEELDKIILPLKKKKEIIESQKDILKYLDEEEKVDNIDKMLVLLTAARRVTSRCQTDFSTDVVIDEFGEYLDNEYVKLNFEKPKQYKLKTTTPGINKRVYRVGEKKIKDILSEGEQKQHALADFFAQAEMEKYKGVYIFDDPVTSLDDRNIEKVADRIVTLSNNGNNQIIVFTHNKYFLNSLLEQLGGEGFKHHRFSRKGLKIFLERDITVDALGELSTNRKELKTMVINLKEKHSKDELISESEIRIAYDFISNCLEALTEGYLLNKVISRNRPNIRMGSLRKIEWNNDLVEDVSNLYSKTNRIAIRHAQAEGIVFPELKELLEDVAKMESFIEYFNKKSR